MRGLSEPNTACGGQAGWGVSSLRDPSSVGLRPPPSPARGEGSRTGIKRCQSPSGAGQTPTNPTPYNFLTALDQTRSNHPHNHWVSPHRRGARPATMRRRDAIERDWGGLGRSVASGDLALARPARRLLGRGLQSTPLLAAVRQGNLEGGPGKALRAPPPGKPAAKRPRGAPRLRRNGTHNNTSGRRPGAPLSFISSADHRVRTRSRALNVAHPPHPSHLRHKFYAPTGGFRNAPRRSR